MPFLVNTGICFFHDFTERQRKYNIYIFQVKTANNVLIPTLKLNPFQASVAFHIETVHVICSSSQMFKL